MAETEHDTHLIELAAGIVENYVANNQLQPGEVPSFLERIHGKLTALQNGQGSDGAAVLNDRPEPPVKPRNSVRRNDVVCLECGKTYKTLKRHLRTEHGLDEDAYKQRWELPAAMKLVAKSYSEKRSSMAKEIGLGARPSARSKK